MTTPTIDVGNLVALKCTGVSMTVPEKTRHRKYAAEALAATIEFFNALHESKKVDIKMCRADYVHGSTRSFIFEVPAGDADDIALTISEDLTFETVDNVGSYTLGMPTRYSEAQESANHATSMWRGYLKCPAGWLHAPDHFSTQINQHFNRAGLNVEKIAVLRDKEYGVATSDYAIEFTPQDISGYVDVGYVMNLAKMEVYGRTQKVTIVFEPYKEIAIHWGICKVCLGIPRRTCTCHKDKTRVDVAGASTATGTRAEAKANRMEALKRKAKAAAEAKKASMRVG